jgi:glycosyltransferase involved in cell wall biosynthesis
LSKKRKEIAILLATFNGEDFLDKQIKSIINQSFKAWHLYISDDGSVDNTKNIIGYYKKKYPHKITIYKGPGMGFVANFFSILKKINYPYTFYAYCDQDDRWSPNKLQIAKKYLSIYDGPALFLSNVKLTNQNDEVISMPKMYKFKPNFQHAIFQNYSSGNTMVYNNHLKDILIKYTSVKTPAHDWWTYIIATFVGSKIICVNKPLLDYRQHDKSLIGYKFRFFWAIKNLSFNTCSNFSVWLNIHLLYLQKVKEGTLDNKNFLNNLFFSYHAGFIKRLNFLFKNKIFRKNFLLKLAFCLIFLMK